MRGAVFALWTALAIVGCGPSYGVSRTITDWNGKDWIEHPAETPQPPRPSGCELEQLTKSSLVPSETSHYIAIGEVWLVGGDPSSTSVLDNVQRRACALGGDAIMLIKQGHTFRSGHMATFYVLKHGAPIAP